MSLSPLTNLKKIKMALWNKEDCATLVKLRDEKVPYQDIAQTLKRTPMACHLKYKLLIERGEKYRGRGWSNRETDLLIQMVDARRDWEEISTKIKRSTMACKMKLHAILKVEGIDSVNGPRAPWSQAETDTLHKMVLEGSAYKLIGETIGRSEMACRKRWITTSASVFANKKARPPLPSPPPSSSSEGDEEEEEDDDTFCAAEEDEEDGRGESMGILVSSPLPQPDENPPEMTSAMDAFFACPDDPSRLDTMYRYKEWLSSMPANMESWTSRQVDVCDHLIQAILLSISPSPM